MTTLPPAALAAAENFLPLSVVNDGETIKLSDRNGNSVASMMFVSLRGRHDPDAISALAKLLVEAVNARHMPAPASDGEVEAAIEAVEAAVKLAPLEYVSPDGSHVYEPANSKRRLKEAARLLRSLPALRAENERLTALLERNRE